MTIAYRCDGPSCATVLDQEQIRIDVSVVNEAVEPVEVDEESTGFAELKMLKIGFDADHHFCSMTCLSAWGFAKQLEVAQ